MENSRDRRGSAGLASRKWRSTSALHAVHEVNERVVELLTRLASVDWSRSECLVINHCGDLLRRLDQNARRRMATLPVLMLDVHFGDEGWWSGVIAKPTMQSDPVGHTKRFPRRHAVELLRQCLVLAWTTVRVDSRAARLLFGMSTGVARLVADLNLQDIDRVTARFSHELSLRWESRPEYWRRLLFAAIENNEKNMHQLHLYTIQLIGGALLNSR